MAITFTPSSHGIGDEVTGSNGIEYIVTGVNVYTKKSSLVASDALLYTGNANTTPNPDAQIWFQPDTNETLFLSGGVWTSATSPGVIISDTEPANARDGTLWKDTTNDDWFLRRGGVWVEEFETDSDELVEYASFNHDGGVAGFFIQTALGSPYTIDWGDDTVVEDIAGNTTALQTHTLTGPSVVKVFGPEGDEVSRLQFGNLANDTSDGAWRIDITDIPRSVTRFDARGNSMIITGDLNLLPPKLERCYVYTARDNTNNQTYGTDVKLPSTLTYLYIIGGSNANFNVTDLPSGLTEWALSGPNNSSYVYGEISDLPRGLLVFSNVQGLDVNDLNGDVADLPLNLTVFNDYGNRAGRTSQITGNYASVPRTVTTLNLRGNNSVSGDISDLPPNLRTFYQYSANATLTGDIADLPVTINIVYVSGKNTVTGDLASLNTPIIHTLGFFDETSVFGDIASLPSNISQFLLGSAFNTTLAISGDLSSLASKPNLNYFYSYGGDTNLTANTTFTPGADPMNRIYINKSATNTLSQAEVDNILQSFVGSSWFLNKSLELVGSSVAAPSATGETYIAQIEANGATVITN